MTVANRINETLIREAIFEWIKTLISEKKVISISGASGTGKTTLAQFLVGNILAQSEPYTGSCIWIQASEAFPKKRLSKMFESQPDKLKYLTENIFVTPGSGPCISYSEQSKLLIKFSKDDFMVLPDLKFIVIDNVSHHLRYELSKTEDIRDIMSLRNRFFDDQLYPLIMFCLRENINLILIHEVSYNVKEGKEVSFYDGLYNRISSLKFTLEKKYNSQEKLMHIKLDDTYWAFSYYLINEGFEFIP